MYSELVRGDFQAREVIDYLGRELKGDLVFLDLARHLDRIEGFLYCADRQGSSYQAAGMPAAFGELIKMRDGSEEIDSNVLSERAMSADKERIRWMLIAMEDGVNMGIDRKVFERLASLIDTR